MIETNVTSEQAVGAVVQFIKELTPCEVRISQINRVPAGKGDRVYVTLLRETPMNYVIESMGPYGETSYTTNVNLTLQIDCYSTHGPNYFDAATTARNIARMVRTNFAAEFFKRFPFEISPINASHTKNMNFINHAGEYEQRHFFELTVNYNPAIITTQPYFTEATINIHAPVDLLEKDDPKDEYSWDYYDLTHAKLD